MTHMNYPAWPIRPLPFIPDPYVPYIPDINAIGRLQRENLDLKQENERIKREIKRLCDARQKEESLNLGLPEGW